MPPQFCQPCKARGRETTATRIVGTTPKCDACWRGNVGVQLSEAEKTAAHAAAPPPLAAGAETKPSSRQRSTPINWPQIQARRSAGESAESLAKELRCSISYVYLMTKGGRVGRPKRSAAPAESKPAAGIRFVSLEEMPGGAGVDCDRAYRDLYDAVVRCPAGQCVRGPVPRRAAAAKNPSSAIRGALARFAKFQKRKIRIFVRVKDGMVWIATAPRERL